MTDDDPVAVAMMTPLVSGHPCISKLKEVKQTLKQEYYLYFNINFEFYFIIKNKPVIINNFRKIKIEI